jgi:acyl-CoA synthetase (AMP-forming)/AMP-acid ligase II
MTETTSMVTLLDKSDCPDLWTTAGRVLPYREVAIIDNDGKPSPVGWPGRIMIRGEVVSRRHLGEPERQRLPDEWFDTGDIGAMDSSGYLTVAGRRDNIIVSGGENIDLTRIETVLNAVSGIKGSVVISREDEKWGHRPVAFVELYDENISEGRIREELAVDLPRFMLPDRIVIVRSLPLTVGGKYDRTALPRLYPDIFARDR